MKHPTSAAAIALALGFLSIPVAHAQATIDDCEKIQAADAYNQCLAKFGPTSKVKSVEPVRPGDVKDSSAEAAAGAQRTATVVTHGARRHGRPARRGRVVAHGTHRKPAKSTGGRKRMVITIKRHK